MQRLALIHVLYLLCFLFTVSWAQTVKLVKPGKFPEDGDCVYVRRLPRDKQCQYITKDPRNPCDSSEGFFFNYAALIYCGDYNLYVVMLCFTIVVINLFLMVGLTADGFFCPALAAIAVQLGMSEHLAGVSLVAFGNGAPDLFTSVSGLTGDPNVELVYSQLMGGGLFVTLFVVGIICMTAPFRVEGKLFIRDCLFYVAAVIWAFMVLRNPIVRFWEAIVFLVIYAVYVTAVVLSGTKNKPEEEMESRLKARESVLRRKRKTFDPKELMYMQMVTKMQCGRKGTKGMGTEVIIIQHGLFMEFVKSIWPFEDWHESDILGRIISIWEAPYKIFLRLIIPVVDYDAPRHGWCKLLNIVNVFLLPIYVNFITRTVNYYPIGGVPMILITFLLSVSLAIFVGLTSIQIEPPGYHSQIFAPLAFIGSVITVYATANEVVAVINAIGLNLQATPTTLGCTFLAWGNSIGDFVTIRGLAVKGYPRMAFAGVYGGTIFNILLSLGTAALVATVTNGKDGKGYHFNSDIGTLGANMMMYMLSGLVSCLIMLPVMGFQARKSYGKYLLVIYALFNVKIWLNEAELIHPLERMYIQQMTYPNGTVLYKDVKVLPD